jgi:hypothetical protein
LYKHPGGPETVLVKITFFKQISFSPERNKKICKPNGAKFSRDNLAKIAFRVGFGFISLGHVDRLFLSFFLFKADICAA